MAQHIAFAYGLCARTAECKENLYRENCAIVFTQLLSSRERGAVENAVTCIENIVADPQRGT